MRRVADAARQCFSSFASMFVALSYSTPWLQVAGVSVRHMLAVFENTYFYVFLKI